mmetsp:Transcript_42262/g.122215  ORF Transcript_42262/g.122215 Transcript_42262/m.122215 type:complete len:211 (+) Transcript_42262:1115-1747(+)
MACVLDPKGVHAARDVVAVRVRGSRGGADRKVQQALEAREGDLSGWLLELCGGSVHELTEPVSSGEEEEAPHGAQSAGQVQPIRRPLHEQPQQCGRSPPVCLVDGLYVVPPSPREAEETSVARLRQLLAGGDGEEDVQVLPGMEYLFPARFQEVRHSTLLKGKVPLPKASSRALRTLIAGSGALEYEELTVRIVQPPFVDPFGNRFEVWA